MKRIVIGTLILIGIVGTLLTLSALKTRKHTAPGSAYLFFDADSILHESYHGVVDVLSETPVTGSTTFHAFSTTKTFTAVGVLQLLEKGWIDLNASVEDYIPSYKFSHTISVKDLLAHQSGLLNPIPLKWVHLAINRGFDYSAFADSIVLRNLKLKRKPGRKFSYSNLNYLVLGRLIEEVSGMAYSEYIQRNVLDKLGSREFIGFDLPQKNHARGYYPNSWFQNLLLSLLLDKSRITEDANEQWRSFKPFYVDGQAYGGLFASSKAMMAYCQALFTTEEGLLGESALLQMFNEQLTSEGKGTGMCLGWFKGSLEGIEYFCHAGGGGGYYSEIRIYPTLKMGSVYMSNASGMRDLRLLDEFDKKFIKTKDR